MGKPEVQHGFKLEVRLGFPSLSINTLHFAFLPLLVFSALTPGTTTLSTGLPPLPPRAVVSPPALTAPSLRICSPKPLACQAEEDCDVQDVHATLNELLDNCRKSVQVRGATGLVRDCLS